MSVVEEFADKMAAQTVDLVERTGDLDLVKRVAEIMGASSQTLQESFLTAVRVRTAANRAEAFLKDYEKNLS